MSLQGRGSSKQQIAKGELWGIVLAGGLGRRLGTTKPKQFLEVASHPILTWTLSSLLSCCSLDALLLVAAKGYEHLAEDILGELELPLPPCKVLTGGDSRQESARIALSALGEHCSRVIIHDGARPFVSKPLIDGIISAFAHERAVIPAVAERNTLKKVGEGYEVIETLPRKGLWEVQTPQAFFREDLDLAHSEALSRGVEGTDDASLLEAIGLKVTVVPGDQLNLKVTDKRDIFLMRAIIEAAGLVPGEDLSMNVEFEDFVS